MNNFQFEAEPRKLAMKLGQNSRSNGNQEIEKNRNEHDEIDKCTCYIMVFKNAIFPQ